MPPPASLPPPAQPPVTPAPAPGANGQNGQSAAGTVNRALRSAAPLGYRLKHRFNGWSRRLRGKPRGVSEGPNLLPLLIRVLACFSKLDGRILEEEIDSILGFLRHDYPETVYSELRKQFRQALNEQPDLDSMAGKLNAELSPDRKILLGIQLWDLICRAGQQTGQVVAFYKFMGGTGHDGTGHRHRLPAQLIGKQRPCRVPEGSVAAGIADVQLRRYGRRALPRPAGQRQVFRLSLPRSRAHQEPVYDAGGRQRPAVAAWSVGPPLRRPARRRGRARADLPGVGRVLQRQEERRRPAGLPRHQQGQRGQFRARPDARERPGGALRAEGRGDGVAPGGRTAQRHRAESRDPGGRDPGGQDRLPERQRTCR